MNRGDRPSIFEAFIDTPLASPEHFFHDTFILISFCS